MALGNRNLRNDPVFEMGTSSGRGNTVWITRGCLVDMTDMGPGKSLKKSRPWSRLSPGATILPMPMMRNLREHAPRLPLRYVRSVQSASYVLRRMVLMDLCPGDYFRTEISSPLSIAVTLGSGSVQSPSSSKLVALPRFHLLDQP